MVCIDEEIPFEIPNGWEWCRLNGICYLIEDCPHSTAPDEGNGYPLVRTPNVGFAKLELKGVHRVCEETYKKRNARATPQRHDLIFAREAPAGNIAVIEEERVCLGQRTVLVRPVSKYINPYYLAYYILSPLSQKALVANSTGTTVAHVNLADFRPYIIAIPPYSEQIRIVDKIKHLLSFIDKYGKCQIRLDKLNESIDNSLKKSILQEAIQGRLVPQDSNDEPASILLKHIKEEKLHLVKEGKLKKKGVVDSVIFKGDDNKYYEQISDEVVDITEDIPFDVPEGWSWCRLKSICTIFTGATFKKEDANTDKTGIRILRGGNILPFEITFKGDDIFLPYNAIKENILLRKNDIVTPAVTSLENIGKMALVKDDLPDVTVGGFVFVLRLYFSNEWLSQYLLALMSSPTIIEYMKSITNKSGQAFYNIGKDRLATTLLPIPPLSEQQRIVNQIEKIFSEIKGN